MSRKTSIATTSLETLQWFIFLLASSVAMPIVIGSIFDMSVVEISGLMQRTLFVVGLASLLQGIIGHRLPIMEGPAGIWISVFSVMAITGVRGGNTLTETLQTLEAAMFFTGLFLVIFGLLKISSKILPIFTPLVTGTFFLLLTVQLSGTFLKGMLIQADANTIYLPGAIIAFITFFIVLALSAFGKGTLRSYAVLIGIIFGWINYLIFIGGNNLQTNSAVFTFPKIFAFGKPTFDLSVIPIAFITAIILISNMVASIVAMNQTLGNNAKLDNHQVNSGTIFSGISHGFAGLFSTVANVPLATSSGFIGLTGQKRKQPFIYANIILILIAFFPPIISFISSIPSPVANAALMASFVQLVGLAINNLTITPLDSRKVTILGTSYLIGMGTMFLPTEAFSDLPTIVQNVMSNGLLVGTALVILMEQIWREKTSIVEYK
ncbi:purine/pyrimidine permease [Bacillus kwashiorkori]|uniref:purine/pyrimidine permease n=1 Tax=Bacillus kwashiorkori TaxID=1522318 RepID=UPI000785B2EE|nr:purine/pyrimidine permease [Bacillus kwashiorkori]